MPFGLRHISSLLLLYLDDDDDDFDAIYFVNVVLINGNMCKHM